MKMRDFYFFVCTLSKKYNFFPQRLHYNGPYCIKLKKKKEKQKKKFFLWKFWYQNKIPNQIKVVLAFAKNLIFRNKNKKKRKRKLNQGKVTKKKKE